MKKVLITGGAGHIGSHLATHILENTSARITFLDRLDFSGNLNRVEQSKNWDKHRRRCYFVFHDLRAPISDSVAQQLGDHDVILHLAALTDVDRSISDPLLSVADNVLGTAHILEHARRGCERFVYFGTDEIYGPAPPGVDYLENDRYNCTNPYSATKAAGEELTNAYWHSYSVPVLITHCMNVFGEMQNVTKYIPSTIAKVRDGETVTVHADPTLTRAGSRFYIHARNTADAVLHILTHGKVGEKFNIRGEVECDNLQLAKLIAAYVGRPLRHTMVDAHSSRPGHDLRYALDGSKLRDMGWTPPVTFEESLHRVVEWSLAHPNWLAPCKAVRSVA
jgi:dTDP-glucose 4,6-dehydratase